MTVRDSNTQQDFLGSIWTGFYKKGSSSQHETVQRLMTTPKGRRAREPQGGGPEQGHMCLGDLS